MLAPLTKLFGIKPSSGSESIENKKAPDQPSWVHLKTKQHLAAHDPVDGSLVRCTSNIPPSWVTAIHPSNTMVDQSHADHLIEETQQNFESHRRSPQTSHTRPTKIVAPIPHLPQTTNSTTLHPVMHSQAHRTSAYKTSLDKNKNETRNKNKRTVSAKNISSLVTSQYENNTDSCIFSERPLQVAPPNQVELAVPSLEVQQCCVTQLIKQQPLSVELAKPTNTPIRIHSVPHQAAPLIKVSCCAQNQKEVSGVEGDSGVKHFVCDQTNLRTLPTANKTSNNTQVPSIPDCKGLSIQQTDQLLGCSKEFNSLRRGALQRLGRLKTTITSLEKAIVSEFETLYTLETALQKANLFLHDAQNRYKTTEKLINSRQQHLANTDQRFQLLTAENLSNCSLEDLGDLSDVLWSGLQSASLSLFRKQDRLLTFGFEQNVDLLNEATTVTNVSIPQEPEPQFDLSPFSNGSGVGNTTAVLCKQLTELSQGLKEVQEKVSDRIRKKREKADLLKESITLTTKNYRIEQDRLLTLERKLETRHRQIGRLTGTYSCEDMAIAQLSELCKMISKASKKVTTEQLLRQIAAQQQRTQLSLNDASTVMQKGLTMSDPNKCIVCFERPWDTLLEPCHHELCSDCGTMLHFCPQCRKSITGTKPTVNTQSELAPIVTEFESVPTTTTTDNKDKISIQEVDDGRSNPVEIEIK